MKIFFTLIIIACAFCSGVFIHDKKEINFLSIQSSDTSLKFINGFWLYKKNLFSGKIIERYVNNNVHRITEYLDGKENGSALSYFPDGEIEEKRFYKNGEKDGIHKGWWQNGKQRFEYHFTNGLYNGDFKEWYNDGKKYKLIHYKNGIDDWGKGWRETGKLFMNYVMKDNRRYGIVNSNLCYSIKNGSGEYINSIK